ncbi:MAG: ATP-binding cassette domain-containing protein [Longibaculum sp.]
MLELKNIHVSYGNHIIYNNASFCAHHNELTIVMGKSGSGKSTLHQLMTFHDVGKCEYYFNDEDIGQLSYGQKQEFIKEKMGIVNQVPSFINDLKIKDHIGLCQSLWNGYDVQNYIERLEIGHVLDEYPKQLSGGEKIRVSILLSMIHQPEILVFDEPTASLDKHQSHVIVDLLKEYAHQGHIVIIFTHDKLMKDEGDVVYFIEDKQLQCIIKKPQMNYIEKEQISKVKKISYIQYIYKMMSHKKSFKLCMISFVALAIALSCFSIFYGNSVIDKYKDQLQGVDKAGVIMRNSQDNFLFNNSQPIGKEEVNSLKNIQSIDDIWPYIIFYEDLGKVNFRVFQDGKLMEEREGVNSYDYNGATYNEDYKYSTSHLDKVFDVDEGIYIEKYFLYYLLTGEVMGNINELNQEKFDKAMSSVNRNTEIELTVFIPHYIETNQRNQDIYSQPMTVKTKIKGIYSRYYELQLCKETNGAQIIYPLRIEEELRQKIQNKALPAISDREKTITPYYPLFYQFSVKDGYSFLKTKEAIEALGFKVLSLYDDMENQVMIAENLNESIFMISGLIFCVVILMLLGVKYNQREEFLEFIDFFVSRGFTYKQAKKMLSYYFIYEAFLSAVLSMAFMAMILFVFFIYIYQEFLTIHFEYFSFCILLAVIIEVGLPLFIIGGGKK